MTYLAIVDELGQIVGTDSDSKLNVQISQTNDAGDYAPILGGSTQFASVNGVFTVENIEFTGTPGAEYKLSFTTDAIDVSLPAT